MLEFFGATCQKILAPVGGSGVGLRHTPVLPVTEQRPCAHANTWKRSAVGLWPTKMGNSDLFWADFSHFRPVLANLEDFLTEKKTLKNCI